MVRPLGLPRANRGCQRLNLEFLKMRNIIKKNKIGWPEMDSLSGTDFEMQRWIQKLDTVCNEYESRWGVSRLQTLVPYDLAQKWKAQTEKLNAAIMSSNLYDMPELVEGTIRGYAALEAAAIAQGHKPHDAPLCWTTALGSGKTLAIVRHNKDASLLADLKRDHPDVVVWTLEEIANIIEKDHVLVNVVKGEKPLPDIKAFDFTKGDKLPDEF